mmetsp:Transcript_22287/g.32575  ORF Transcript_22287/g.32575 Transcript_22287/m.32575 type:complete len:202 (+) Transcript_22287:147-752(+)
MFLLMMMMMMMMMMMATTTNAFSRLPLQRCMAQSSTSILKALPEPQPQRRRFLNSIIAKSTLLITIPPPSNAVTTITPESARAQLDAVISNTDKLLADWDTVTKGGGDAIRKELGTVGTGSPFYQINKAIRVLQNDANDPVAFGDASEQFEIRLAGADAMAYSAVFTGGSGKPTPPEVYFKKSKVEVEALRRVEADMIEAL